MKAILIAEKKSEEGNQDEKNGDEESTKNQDEDQDKSKSSSEALVDSCARVGNRQEVDSPMRIFRMMAPPSVTSVQTGSGQDVDLPMNVSPMTAPPENGGTVNDDIQQ